MRKILIALSLVCLFASCGNRQTYLHTYQAIPNDGWHVADSLFFPIPVQVDDTNFNAQLEVRHHVNYNYKNLPLLVECVQQNTGSVLSTDTINMVLMDDSGNWLGKGIGRLLQMESSLGTLHIAKADTCQVRVMHLNPDSLLGGISDVGLRLY